MNEYSTIRKVDDSTVEITTYVHYGTKKLITIKFSAIIAFVAMVACILIAHFALTNANNGTGSQDLPCNQPVGEEDCSRAVLPFSNDGFVFPQSSSQYISQDDLDNLRLIADASDYSYQELLRFAVNEIYARHGYQFIPSGRFDVFYSQYPWYTESAKVDVTWDMFNACEQHNLNLILNEEQLNGFRD